MQGAQAGVPSWLPGLIGVLFFIGLVVVIAVAVAQRSKAAARARARRAPLACGNCGQPMARNATHCASCGWMPPPPPPREAELEFIYGPLEGQTYRIQSEITTIGSQPGNSIVIPDPAVSRKHVGIRRDPHTPGFYEIADLGSTNGVYINGQRMAKRLLAAGDIIRIGASEMVFQLEKVG